MSDDPIRRAAEKLAQALADDGRLIEAGWQVYRSIALRDIRSVAEIDRYREAFLSGASHTFTAMITMMEAGELETDNNMRRMDLLHQETSHHEDMLRLKYGKASGSG